MNIKTPTHGLSVKFVDYEIKDGHVDYRILVKNSNTNQSWTTVSRFSSLEKIHKKLVELNGDKALPNFPAKAYWGNLEPSFISQRQKGLEIYFMLVLQNGSLKNIKALLDFLGTKGPEPVATNKTPDPKPQKKEEEEVAVIKPTPQTTLEVKDKSLEKTVEQIDRKFYDLQVTLNPPEDDEVRKRTSLYAAIKLEMNKSSAHEEFKLPKAGNEHEHAKSSHTHNPEFQQLLANTVKNVRTQLSHLHFLQNCKLVKEFDT